MKLSLVLASLLAFPLLANVPSAKIRVSVSKAIRVGDVKAVATYIDKYDLDLNILLLYATAEGSFKTVDYLIKNGADVNCSDECDVSPLDIVPYNKIEIGTLLKQAGATTSVSKRGLDADLLAAAEEGAIEEVLRLIKLGANIEARDDDNAYTALMHAASSGNTEIVKLLLKHKANIKAKNNFGWTALMYATRWGNIEIVKLLLKYGANIEAQDNHGNTALMIAAMWGGTKGIKTVKLLIKYNANIEAQDDKGQTALIHAARGGSPKIVKLLLKLDANIEAKDKGVWTPLMIAASRRNTEIVNLLLEHKAKVEAKDK